jgi:hypothetical protein
MTVLFFAACSEQKPSEERTNEDKPEKSKKTIILASQTSAETDYRNLLTLPDAEKILGEKAHITDSGWTNEKEVTVYKSTYTANAKEPESGKTGNIYFMYEEYNTSSSAGEVYTSIKKSNENHGIQSLNGLGDEAYYHTDGENFYFILARKGGKMIRMKVNKVTLNSSEKEFKQVAGEIVGSL